METEQSTTGVMPRACQNCRLRKVRCNRVFPCSNCVTSGLTCQLVRSTRQKNSMRSDVTISEKPLESLHQRLAALEEAVKGLGQQNNAGDQTHITQSIDNNNLLRQGLGECRAAFPEGDSAFGRLTLLASQIMELKSAQAAQSPVVVGELANLRRMVQDQTASQRLGHVYTSDPRCGNTGPGMGLLPSEFVLRLLKTIKGIESSLFLFYGVHDRAQVEELCRRVYFPIEPLSSREITLCNGMLSIMMYDLDLISSHEFKEEDVKYFRGICEANFQAGLETYEVMAVPAYEHAMILSLAMIHAQKEAKLALQWSLTSTAARHCLALGYHREDHVAQMPSRESARVRRLFWQVYTSDKNLSSRLGRTSTIQDFDIDVKALVISQDPRRAPWDFMSAAFVEFSSIQGQIYDALYSVAARKLDMAGRQSIVTSLSTSLTQWHNVLQQIDSSNAYYKEIFECTFGPANIIYYSVLTLIYRGATASNSTHDILPACFEAARQGLQAQLRYYPEVVSAGPQALSSFAVWIFYYAPFSPFVVTFLYCVANSDSGDLELLKDVLGTLEHISPSSEYIKRQHGMCKALYRIAEAFMESRNTANGQGETTPKNTLVLPLQNPLTESWESWLFLDSSLQSTPFTGARTDNWEGASLNHTLFSLDNGAGSNYV